MKRRILRILLFTIICFIAVPVGMMIYFKVNMPNETNPEKVELITADIENFWEAYDQSVPEFEPEVFQEFYIDKGSSGLEGYIDNRIRSAEYLSSVIRKYPDYYHSIRKSSLKIDSLYGEIRSSFYKLQEIYPESIFPPVYFVIGALNSGGTSTMNELVIASEFYALTSSSPLDELSEWQRRNIKPLDEIPHIVAHEVVHFQQNSRLINHLYKRSLLSASIKEGAADFIAELTSGKHINQKVHSFADPREEKLWLEFKSKMYGEDYSGWLYSQPEGRPSDLGYWMGYKIVEAYYQKATDKDSAIWEIINVRDYDAFLEQSGYAKRFNN